MRDKLFKIGLYTVNYVLENFESVHILGMYKYTLFEILKALSRDGNDFRIWMIWKQWQKSLGKTGIILVNYLRSKVSCNQ